MAPWNLHLVNVRLPLLDESKLYELKGAGGRWMSVKPQPEGTVPAAGALKLPLLNGKPHHDGETVRLDLEGRMLLPGFVDAHMHLDKAYSLAKVGNRSGTLEEAVRNYGAAVPGFSREEIRSRIRRSALAALSYGTRSIRSHLDFNLKAGREVAMRTVHAALEVREELKNVIDIQFFPMLPYGLRSPGTEEALAEGFRLGLDGIGGAPHLSPEPEADIDWIFALAEKYGRPVDLHADESDDPGVRTVAHIARRTVAYGMQGKVTADHLCALSAMDEKTAGETIRAMADAGLSAVTLPAVNLYLQGRGDRGLVRRGTTRIRELLEAGIPLAVASDNIQDPFHPFGRGDLLQIGQIAGYAGHLGAPGDLRTVLRMLTSVPAAILGLEDYGTAPGLPAHGVVLDARSVDELFAEVPPSRWVLRQGEWIHASVQLRVWDTLQLAPAAQEGGRPAGVADSETA
ncbi:amidohydrolase family protein [Paenibacillus mucilaginosus]|uniref:Amidohydrolase 3 n=1 Tax=Paenibacillus mucilaginosus (strain KNP414) TaxID=1036673 RepID=F8FDC8_PAEMK|nr:amidohydrolase family protein [Paenibacillus mucilaginosus]AEI41788.1 Amidohydrolase 3 [Paenibacillus mucilaginosus KNP414]MCG7214472.1 amidohydrolase family protein [Paenibacillus mucilaginosus]WDM30754.1 amidohydrolase family protein [Paenibacillus mucilaginosus]